MDSQTAAPNVPPPAYTAKESETLPTYTASNDVEAQQTSWTASPPPTYLPSWQPQPTVVTVRTTRPQNRSPQNQRRGLLCCLLVAFLIVAIFIIVTIVEVVQRYNAQVNNP